MKILRAVIGLFFIGTGAFKLFGSVGGGAPSGPAGFAEMLAAAGIPFAVLNAWMVCAIEIGCGTALIASVFIARPLVAAAAAVILVVDMCVAIATVGIRAQLGHPVVVRGVPTAGEPWRLALEVVMLVLLVVTVATSARSMSSMKRPP